MSKIDVSVTRSLTINTGNYESIKPTVTVTARDIDAANVDQAYLQIGAVLEGLMKFETLHCSETAEEVSKGLNEYCRNVRQNADAIGNRIEAALDKLNEI